VARGVSTLWWRPGSPVASAGAANQAGLAVSSRTEPHHSSSDPA
jgi:hypothetical protein